MRHLAFVPLIVKFCFIAIPAMSQTKSYNQFWNDFQFMTPINNRWTTEVNIGQVWTSVPAVSNSLFYANAQQYIRGWIHYYAGRRWKLSAFTGYNHNRAIKGIKQQALPEIRSALQVIYYFKKRRYTLTNRVRFEDHHKKNEDGGFSVVYRLRNQLKLILPFNDSVIRKGTWYGAVSGEIFAKTSSASLSSSLNKSNRFTIGAGYSFTNDFLVEIDYSNDYYFIKNNNESYHTIQLNLSFYNWLPHLKDRFSKRRS